MDNNTFPGKIAVMGGGSWATALAKLLMANCPEIMWYMRRDDRIEEFRQLGHNPAYLTDVHFDTDRIHFSSDINRVCTEADTLLMVMPSPYFSDHIAKINVDLSDKTVVSAIKGIVPQSNELISDFMVRRFGVDPSRMIVVSGPCHAEEVALDRPSYLTVGCRDLANAEAFAALLRGRRNGAICSADVDGIEYASVLKNVYAIAAGIVHGTKTGDNFNAVLVSNAIREMDRFLQAACPAQRNICDSVYLGDLLVTAYSRFSRNHNFGSMIGCGYSVRSARMEMNQTAEGYYGARCIHEINDRLCVDMPILENVYNILYHDLPVHRALVAMAHTFN